MKEKAVEQLGDWADILKDEFQKPYMQNLQKFLKEERSKFEIYPPKQNTFTAFKLTQFANTKVIILGQDPYHGSNQAHGLSFSVQNGVKPPPSLMNIFKELSSDIGCGIPNSGNLSKWAEQGVLLLNTTLTVRKGKPASHAGNGWEEFTSRVIKTLSEDKDKVIFILWGKHAQNKKHLIDQSKHKIIESAHPSPFSAHKGFFGSKPFSKVNEFLEIPIDWSLS